MTAQPATGPASLTAPQAAPGVEPNAAALSAAASMPAQLPPASSNFFDQFDPPAPASPASSTASGGNSAALSAAASIPVDLPAASAQPATSQPGASALQAEGPWTRYQTTQPSQPAPAVTRDPWERPTAVPASSNFFDQFDAPAEGPWTKYQTAPVTRDPWERPANNDDKPWLDYQPAQPATAQSGPRAWGQASNLDDPYANASLADSAAAIGRTADNAVRNTVDGMTLGYGDKIAAGLDAMTGRSPDYASALNAERGQSDRAMAEMSISAET